jgi:hypothetical protein
MARKMSFKFHFERNQGALLSTKPLGRSPRSWAIYIRGRGRFVESLPRKRGLSKADQ